ncbi:unnamed protein product [Aspergillus oryzae RIB40]|uniref:DNA, SC023 n=1 Tax=Aspergillus oryzae (strain ATCC 42149 / RIB 40) TaxID=510516 RepID=Q2UGT2_ASPOR|nr:unnamed protein product [Aspergillus oryzae RIB40]BAE59233.1 unnamed protein product [Aspergillus oryzae RIB40]
MLGSWGLVPRSTSVWAAALIILCQLVPLAVALRTAPGSPCANVCNKQSTNTTGSEITCLDTDFTSTSKGSQFKQCVDCQLRSTYSDPSSGETDVDWGLLNCQPLDRALEFDLADPGANNFYTWCGTTTATISHSPRPRIQQMVNRRFSWQTFLKRCVITAIFEHLRASHSLLAQRGSSASRCYHPQRPTMYQQGHGQHQQQQGFSFVDNDGQYRDVGYSKNLTEVTASAVASPPLNLSPDGEKQKNPEHPEYFGQDSKQKR